jgi:diketogulonate reductase-like aldo/keto reductase
MSDLFIYGTAWKKEQTADLVEKAVLNGFRAIDTANQPKHYTEPLVGEALLRLATQGIARKSLFLQTKFTPQNGHDHRIPYDVNAVLADQVMQSFQSSLKNLHTDYLDSYLLHGPYHHPDMGEEDWEVWAAIENLYNEGKVKSIGISNVTPLHVESLVRRAKVKPMIIQNRCFANQGWDAEVRKLCREHRIKYQGFSLLTANPQVFRHPAVALVAKRHKATVAQIIFSLAKAIGIIPLTGTTDENHMRQDLQAFAEIQLDAKEIQTLEREAV